MSKKNQLEAHSTFFYDLTPQIKELEVSRANIPNNVVVWCHDFLAMSLVSYGMLCRDR